MGATVSEQQGLQRAIAAALEKERKERGIVEIDQEHTLYIGVLIIGDKQKLFKERDVNVFIRFCEVYQKSFPDVPLNIFTYSEL